MTDLDFKEIWQKIIFPKYVGMQKEYGELVLLESSMNEIKTYYEETLLYAKNHYMLNSKGKLNRYKVAAAMMIAILKANPIKKASMKYYVESSDKWIFNEKLALFTGLMIVRDFILSEIDQKGTQEEYRSKLLLSKFEKHIPLYNKERDRWEIELYFLRREGAYNLLSLAHELEDFVELTVLRASLDEKKARLKAKEN